MIRFSNAVTVILIMFMIIHVSPVFGVIDTISARDISEGKTDYDSVITAFDDDVFAEMELDDPASGTSEDTNTGSFSFGGYIESRNQLKIDDIDTPISNRQRLWLEGMAGSETLRVFASAMCDYDPAVKEWSDKTDDMVYAEINEGYITFDSEKLDVIAGLKILRWGASDGVNTMDVINPLDHRDPIVNARSTSKQPAPLLSVNLSESAIAVDAIVIVRPEVNGLPLPGSPWEPKSLAELRQGVQDGMVELIGWDRPEKQEYAARVSSQVSSFDLALLYYTGYMDEPVFSRTFIGGGRIRFYEEHPKYDAIGCNFASGLENGTLRGEFAVKPGMQFSIEPNDPGYLTDNDGLVSRNRYESIIGIDYIFFTNLYINFQFFYYFTEDGDVDISTVRNSHGFTYDVHDLFFDDTLESGIRGMAFTSDEGWTAELYNDYKIGDNWILSLGCMLFDGPGDTQLGQYSDNDLVYFNVRYSF